MHCVLFPCMFLHFPCSSTAGAMQIAVMRECDAKGPFCSTVMAVVVVKDVLLFVCLAMNLEFANMVRGSVCPHCLTTTAHTPTFKMGGLKSCTSTGFCNGLSIRRYVQKHESPGCLLLSH